MNQAITDYHEDDEGHWVAQLACGHHQHVRHDPPLVDRQWVTTTAGRVSMLGQTLRCIKCDQSAPIDERPKP